MRFQSRKPTLDTLSARLQSLPSQNDDNFIRLATEFQHSIEEVLGDMIAKVPGRAPSEGHVFCYGRQSKDDIAQMHSKEYQFAALKEYCERNLAQYTLRWPPFFDMGVSGGVSLCKRPAGADLNGCLRRNDHLVIAKFDRAFRSMEDGMRTISLFEKRGIFVHVIDMGLDMTTPVGKLMARHLMSFAQFERELTSVRTKEGLRVARKYVITGGDREPIGWWRTGRSRESRYFPHIEERMEVDYMAGLKRFLKVWEIDQFLFDFGAVRSKNGRPWVHYAVYYALLAQAFEYPWKSRTEIKEMRDAQGFRLPPPKYTVRKALVSGALSFAPTPPDHWPTLTPQALQAWLRQPRRRVRDRKAAAPDAAAEIR